MYASDLVPAWENEQDFLDLHESICQELNLVGSLEDIAVLNIARLHWVKRRLNIGAQLAHHGHPDATHIRAFAKTQLAPPDVSLAIRTGAVKETRS